LTSANAGSWGRASLFVVEAVECELVRWVSDEPQPGLVEARLVDADGVEWSFVDKVPIFTEAAVSATTTFPVPGGIRCEVRGVREDGSGREILDLELRDGVETSDGASRLGVRRQQMRAAGQA
jgi:hypothetical protein